MSDQPLFYNYLYAHMHEHDVGARQALQATISSKSEERVFATATAVMSTQLMCYKADHEAHTDSRWWHGRLVSVGVEAVLIQFHSCVHGLVTDQPLPQLRKKHHFNPTSNPRLKILTSNVHLVFKTVAPIPTCCCYSIRCLRHFASLSSKTSIYLVSTEQSIR